MKTTTIKRLSAQYLLLTALVAAMSLTFGMSTARGELLFSDSFEYPTGPLVGQGPPAGAPPGQTGWSFVSGDPQVSAMGLIFPNVFSAGGGTVFLSSNFDHVVANLTPVTSGVVWLSFLINVTNGDDSGFAVVNLGNGSLSPPTGYGVLDFARVFGIDNDGRGQAPTTIAPGPTPSWLLVKLDFDTGRQTLYVNPMPSTSSPDALVPSARLRMDPAFQAAGFYQVFLNVGSSNGVWGFDEVRIGTTFKDVRTGD
jgi:hypothetical protein